MKYLFLILSTVSLIRCSDNKSENKLQEESNTISKSEKVNLDVAIGTTKSSLTPDTNCTKQLINAVKSYDSIRIKKIINDGCDINKKLSSGHNYYANDSTYETALSNSIDYNITKLLIEKGANPNTELGTGSPLESAVFQHRNDIVKLLIENGANVNHFNQYTEFQSPLIAAISTGNIEALKLLIDNGAKFKAYDKNIYEPLHKSIRHKSLDVAKFLIELGVSTRTKVTPVNLEGDFGDCVPCPYEIEPIHSATQIRDPKISIQFLDLLLSHGADINAKNKHGYNTLGYAACKADSKVAKYLIERGASITENALIRAAICVNQQYLKELLSNYEPSKESKFELSLLIDYTIGSQGGTIQSKTKTVEMIINQGISPSNELIKIIDEQRTKNSWVVPIFKKYKYLI